MAYFRKEIPVAHKIKRYGWKPDSPHNHKKYGAFHRLIENLPPSIDLRTYCPIVYDQGELGSCTGNGVAGCVQFLEHSFMPSRLFIYYNERVMEGDPSEDCGAQIHDGVKVVATQGCCSEIEWPYDIAKFSDKPSDQCYQDALKDLVKNYYSLTNIIDIKNCLHEGFPVVFGTTVFESFESPVVEKNGVIPMPKYHEEEVGGHCMVIVGYDDNKKYFIVRNSWGSAWGVAGYCYIPYSYIEKYASDFWTLRAI